MLKQLLSKFSRQRKLEAPPTLAPSELYRQTASLPRTVKRQHKLGVRRSYRAPWGVMDSRTRQILAMSVAPRVFADREADEQRQEQEDRLYCGNPGTSKTRRTGY